MISRSFWRKWCLPPFCNTFCYMTMLLNVQQNILFKFFWVINSYLVFLFHQNVRVHTTISDIPRSGQAPFKTISKQRPRQRPTERERVFQGIYPSAFISLHPQLQEFKTGCHDIPLQQHLWLGTNYDLSGDSIARDTEYGVPHIYLLLIFLLWLNLFPI